MGLKIPLVNYLMAAVLEGNPHPARFSSLVGNVYFKTKLAIPEGNRMLRGDKYPSDLGSIVILQTLVDFIAAPMPLWSSSGHWISIRERGTKGRWGELGVE